MSKLKVLDENGSMQEVKVLESLGFQPSIGCYVKQVLLEDKMQTVVKTKGGCWRLRKAKDKIGFSSYRGQEASGK